MLDAMPHFYAEDFAAVAYVAAMAAELDRIEAMLVGIRDGAFPQLADDTYRMLGVWEFLVGLPIESSEGVDIRRTKLLAFRRRAVKRTKDWAAAVTTALGTAAWTWERSPGRAVNITLPYGATSFTAGIMTRLIRRITPSHIDVQISYGQGFIIGDSLIGQANL